MTLCLRQRSHKMAVLVLHEPLVPTTHRPRYVGFGRRLPVRCDSAHAGVVSIYRSVHVIHLYYEWPPIRKMPMVPCHRYLLVTRTLPGDSKSKPCPYPCRFSRPLQVRSRRPNFKCRQVLKVDRSNRPVGLGPGSKAWSRTIYSINCRKLAVLSLDK